jgi:aspartate/methionine/tyrosine aminotransferase
MRHKHSDYMHWSKTQSGARFNLATSGVAPFPLRELPLDLEKLEINGGNSYGYAPLQEAIAVHHGVDPECVVESTGTSMANHLAMAAIIEPDDEVLIEHPAYGPILDVAQYLQAKVKRFPRTDETGWAVDPNEIRRRVTAKTRLIVITNLHNPTSVLTPDSVLREIGDIARGIGALVLVDEVYLDAVYEGTPRTSFHIGPEFVVTSSLTKVYGVSGLRCGWILARPDLAWKMRRLNDLYSATAVYPGELLSVVAFQQLDLLRETGRRILEADRKLLRDFLAQQPSVSAVPTDWGTTSFVRLSRAVASPVRNFRSSGSFLRDAGHLSHRHGRRYGNVRRGAEPHQPRTCRREEQLSRNCAASCLRICVIDNQQGYEHSK